MDTENQGIKIIIPIEQYNRLKEFESKYKEIRDNKYKELDALCYAYIRRKERLSFGGLTGNHDWWEIDQPENYDSYEVSNRYYDDNSEDGTIRKILRSDWKNH